MVELNGNIDKPERNTVGKHLGNMQGSGQLIIWWKGSRYNMLQILNLIFELSPKNIS